MRPKIFYANQLTVYLPKMMRELLKVSPCQIVDAPKMISKEVCPTTSSASLITQILTLTGLLSLFSPPPHRSNRLQSIETYSSISAKVPKMSETRTFGQSNCQKWTLCYRTCSICWPIGVHCHHRHQHRTH